MTSDIHILYHFHRPAFTQWAAPRLSLATERFSFVSHTHVHAPKPPAKRSWKVDLSVATVLIGFAALLALGRLVECPSNSPHKTASGTIVETRIVIDHVQESYFGSILLYRAEALVKYQREGRPEEHWITASDITSDRTMLAIKLAAHPQTCLVSWSPGHPENARCFIQEK